MTSCCKCTAKAMYRISSSPFSEARVVAGFASEDAYWPNQDFFLSYPVRQHEVLKNLELLQFLGIDHDDTAMEFPLFDSGFSKTWGIGRISIHQQRTLCLFTPWGHFCGPVACQAFRGSCR